MDYNKIRTFVEVAKTQSISKAANNLFRTQSAISQQIQLLEDELEMPLLERKHRRIYLTKQGQDLFDFCQPRLQAISDHISSIKNDLSSLTGEIRIGIRPDVALHMLPIVLTNFKQTHPNVKFSIYYGDAITTENAVLNNGIDIGILLLVKEKEMFDIYPVKPKNNILVATKTYVESYGLPKTLDELLNLDIIDYTEDNDALVFWIRQTDKKYELKFRKKPPNYVCPDSAIAKELMLKHLGILVIPAYMVEDELRKGIVVELIPKKERVLISSFDIISKKNQITSAAEKAFIETLVREYC